MRDVGIRQILSDLWSGFAYTGKGIVYETSPWSFLFVTAILGGGAAFIIGRAIAKSWKPLWLAFAYVLLLGAGVRFLHWGLFAGATLESWREAQGTLLSLHYYAADTIILLVFSAVGFRFQRAQQMVRQYSWLYKKTGAFTWTTTKNATVQPHSAGKPLA